MFKICRAGLYTDVRGPKEKRVWKDRSGDIFGVITSTWDALGALDIFMPADANAGALQKARTHAWPCLGVVGCTCKQRRSQDERRRRRAEEGGEEPLFLCQQIVGPTTEI